MPISKELLESNGKAYRYYPEIRFNQETELYEEFDGYGNWKPAHLRLVDGHLRRDNLYDLKAMG